MSSKRKSLVLDLLEKIQEVLPHFLKIGSEANGLCWKVKYYKCKPQAIHGSVETTIEHYTPNRSFATGRAKLEVSIERHATVTLTIWRIHQNWLRPHEKTKQLLRIELLNFGDCIHLDVEKAQGLRLANQRLKALIDKERKR